MVQHKKSWKKHLDVKTLSLGASSVAVSLGLLFASTESVAAAEADNVEMTADEGAALITEAILAAPETSQPEDKADYDSSEVPDLEEEGLEENLTEEETGSEEDTSSESTDVDESSKTSDEAKEEEATDHDLDKEITTYPVDEDFYANVEAHEGEIVVDQEDLDSELAEEDADQANHKVKTNQENEEEVANPTASDQVEDLLAEAEADQDTEETIDFAKVHRFATENPEDFNKVLAVAISVSEQADDQATNEEVLRTIGEILLDQEVDPQTLMEVSKFVSKYGRLSQENFESHQEEAGSVTSRDSGLAFYSGEEAESAGPSFSMEDFEKLVGKITGTTDSVVSLLENLQKGERPASDIGAIIDSVLPVNLNFTKIGELIQRIAELKAENVRQDVYLSTEIVGALAELIPSEVQFNGTPVNYVLDKLGQMAFDIGHSVADGMVVGYHPGTFFNANTIRLRAQVSAKAIEVIKTAVTDWRMKPQIVHSKTGLEVTHSFMSVVDPFSTAERLGKRLKELEALLVFGNAYREITPQDIATTYVKEKLDKAIWQTRFDRDEYILSKVPFEVYNDLNKAITKAVGVQLYSETRVYEIDGAVEELQAAYQKAEDYLNNIPVEQQIAPNQLKRELSDLIWQTRFDRDENILGNVSFDVYHDLNQSLTKAVGLQLAVDAKTVDVQAVIDEIKAKLTEAKALAAQNKADRADRDEKTQLRDLIWQARKIRDKELLGNVSFDTYNNLNQVISQAVGTRLRAKVSSSEVTDMMAKLRQTLIDAQNQVNLSADLATV
ncbi:CAMP factor family pore-forming toxin [Aerococcus sp. YH-aer221]|uniref:CAMP factor family pore-forming toxin n=1 Tax=Aerococcus kribbianus TaxID=2999064 RepID=UPI002286C6A0|nr:CAMP factor family pore-forming toxin [Aerococcus sp. YH-aer221]MCZ0717243.1 CAMP factor family pore-forming toxin [Aerococcus sp. YH-aer221]